MELSERLRVTSPDVVADVVDDEIVIVNLSTGAYYNSEGAGCDAWRLLAGGNSIGDVATALGARYDADEGAIERYLEAFVEQLLVEGLMVAAEPGEDRGGAGAAHALPVPEVRAPFEPAQLVQFNDMKGLLLLDPVHEVDDRGWPHAAAGN